MPQATHGRSVGGIRIVVVRHLAKVEARVRFSYPAPFSSRTRLHIDPSGSFRRAVLVFCPPEAHVGKLSGPIDFAEGLTGSKSLMDKVIVAVGSTRKPKLDAVREAMAVISPRLGAKALFDVVGAAVPSGVRHTPLSREEIMTGARQRAEALVGIAREKNEPWKYFVGLEGGIDFVHERGARWVFLENWAYVTDGAGRESFGQSGAVLMPEPLVKSVVDEGVELSEAIDAFAGGHGIRDAQGAWGVLTSNLITRQGSFRIAVINAFAPFFTPVVSPKAQTRIRD
jgi:inosine/xanthosine triphosphatase